MLLATLCWGLNFGVSRSQAQERGTSATASQPADWRTFEAAMSPGVTATRKDNFVRLQLEDSVRSPVNIPRLAAALKSIAWQGQPAPENSLSLKPEPDHWVIGWDGNPDDSERTIVLQFDSPALLPEEMGPAAPSADGSFYLPAHRAATAGEKLRYEPQPHKNTVGYWTGRQDSASWTFQVSDGGSYNIAILQGCGKGQGGSEASLSVALDSAPAGSALPSPAVVQSLAFEVLETGHFQNFQWRHLGQLELSAPGVYRLKIEPRRIAKAALMDVRAVHLIRLP